MGIEENAQTHIRKATRIQGKACFSGVRRRASQEPVPMEGCSSDGRSVLTKQILHNCTTCKVAFLSVLGGRYLDVTVKVDSLKFSVRDVRPSLLRSRGSTDGWNDRPSTSSSTALQDSEAARNKPREEAYLQGYLGYRPHRSRVSRRAARWCLHSLSG